MEQILAGVAHCLIELEKCDSSTSQCVGGALLDVLFRFWLAASIVDALIGPFLGLSLLGLDCSFGGLFVCFPTHSRTRWEYSGCDLLVRALTHSLGALRS